MAENTSPRKGRRGMEKDTSASAPPRENVCRAIRPGYELRESSDGGLPTMLGHFSVFDQWTEINSMWEGNFMERIAPGAYRKTFKENRDGMRVLFQHGNDPQIGDKVLGPIAELREEKKGPYYEVPLLDTSYNRDLIPGLEAGLYGASFRFRVMREEIVEEPGVSAYNPNGLPERTITEARVMEFGPVTFPAYAGATAGVRSLTDEFLLARSNGDPKMAARLLAFASTRFDSEDVGTLAQMIALGAEFIDEQDEADKTDCITQMEGVVSTLTMLMQGEVAEDEPDELGEDGRSADAPSESDAASDGTSGRSAAIPSELFWFAKAPVKGVSDAQA